MKLWVLAGIVTVATVPFAHASEDAVDCGLETPQLLREVTAVAVAAPPAAVTRKGGRAAREEAQNAAPAAAGSGAPAAAPQNDQRRRGVSSRRIPDAMLIDGRGVL